MNPFDGLINNFVKTQFRQAISEVVRACNISCRFYYPITKYTDCTECQQINEQGPNPYLHGGQPGTFTTNCIYCGGTSKIPVETYDDADMCIIYDNKKFVSFGEIVFAPAGSIQTFSDISTIKIIKTCKYAVMNIDNEVLNKNQYIRSSEPMSMGLGEDSFIVTQWKVEG